MPQSTAISVYEYGDYKKFVIHWIERAVNGGRGLRKSLADAVGCQTPFITHVLSGDYHFSPEQAESCARWMGLNDKDTEYFVLLVLRQRAGTRELERHFSKQIARRKEQRLVLKKRVGIRETLTLEDQVTYYSSWIFAAIHMAILNPESRSVEALQNRLRLPRNQVTRAVEFLISRGFVREEQGALKVIKPVLYLDAESPLIGTHHANWRVKAIEAVKNSPRAGLHYSGAVSLSQQDYEWMREKLAELLEQLANQVRDSKDEKLACFNFDWFEI